MIKARKTRLSLKNKIYIGLENTKLVECQTQRNNVLKESNGDF